MGRLINSNKTNQELQPNKTASIRDFDDKLIKRSPKI